MALTSAAGIKNHAVVLPLFLAPPRATAASFDYILFLGATDELEKQFLAFFIRAPRSRHVTTSSYIEQSGFAVGFVDFELLIIGELGSVDGVSRLVGGTVIYHEIFLVHGEKVCC